MSAEDYWTVRLRRFSLVDFALVKLVYFLFGLWLLSLYPALGGLHWGFYLALGLLSGLPLILHWASGTGGVIQRSRAFLGSNTPSHQVLLFLCQFFVAVAVGILLPVLTSGPWWLLLLVIALAAIKPMTKTVLW
jgi:hypothetical protein